MWSFLRLFSSSSLYLCVQSFLSEGKGRPHGIRARSVPVWLCLYKLCVQWSRDQVKSYGEVLGVKDFTLRASGTQHSANDSLSVAGVPPLLVQLWPQEIKSHLGWSWTCKQHNGILRHHHSTLRNAPLNSFGPKERCPLFRAHLLFRNGGILAAQWVHGQPVLHGRICLKIQRNAKTIASLRVRLNLQLSWSERQHPFPPRFRSFPVGLEWQS